MTGRRAPELDALIAYWQKALRLLDWRIEAFYVPDLCAADGAPVYGLVNRTVDNKTATILIRDPSTPVEGAEAKQAEEIVIHELTHLHFAPFGTDSPPAVAAEEQAVWALAEALYANKGTANEQTIARAMVARASRARSATTETRRMDKTKKLLAALAAAEGMKDPEEARAAMKKAKADYEAAPEEGEKKPEEKAPDSKREPEAKPARAAEPEKKPEEEKPKEMTVATVTNIVTRAMRDERVVTELLTANAGRMTPEQRTLFATLPPEQVRAQVAALPQSLNPAAPGKGLPLQRTMGAGVAGSADEGLLPYQIERLDNLMGIKPKAAPPIAFTERAMLLSHTSNVSVVDYVEQQRAAQGKA